MIRLKKSKASKQRKKIAIRTPDTVSEQIELKYNRGRWHPEYTDMAEQACSNFGATTKDLAKLFGVSEHTIYLWQRTHDGFHDAVLTYVTFGPIHIEYRPGDVCRDIGSDLPFQWRIDCAGEFIAILDDLLFR